MCLEIIYFTYMYKKDLALNNLHRLICYKTKPNQTKNIPPPKKMKENKNWTNIYFTKIIFF